MAIHHSFPDELRTVIGVMFLMATQCIVPHRQILQVDQW